MSDECYERFIRACSGMRQNFNFLTTRTMKKLLSLTILIFSIFLLNVSPVSAHEHDFIETKQLIDSGITCDKLTDEQLEAIGDYYMEQMHPSEAYEMMDQMMGGEGSDSLKQIHIQMAKRFYCNEDVGGMMQMMMGGGMMGDWSNSSALNNNFTNPMSMMNFGFAPFGWIFMILFWALIIAGIVALIKWIANQNKTESSHKSALDILKERYARGEIEKKEFEERKKDLGS